MIFNMASLCHLEFVNFWYFCHVSVAWDKICVSIINIVKFGCLAAQIWKFSKWRSSAMLDFRNLTFSSSNVRVRAIMPSNSKFRLNRTIWSRVITRNDFQYGVRPPSWIWEFLNFCHVYVAFLKICVCIPDFVKFGRFAAEIWRYNDFQNGGRPPCWIFEIWHFHHLAVVRVQLCLLIPNFVSIGPYGAEL